jgi:hypothetical protein
MNEAYTSATQRIAPERIEDDRAQQAADCALVQDLLPLYLDNEVSPESHARIATHIAQCERCAGYLAGARSVRAQLVRNQQAVHNTTTAAPAVTVPPRPTTNTLLPKLKQMLLVAAAVIGALILAPVLIPVAVVAAIPVGIFIVGRAIWQGVRGRSAGTPAFPRGPRGSAGAMFAAIVSVLGVLVCAGLVFSGLVILTETGDPPEQLVGVLMLLFGSSGLVTINQRRGWLPQYASPPAVEQLFKLILLAGGVLTAAVIIPGMLASMPLLLVALVLAWIFLFRTRSAKP